MRACEVVPQGRELKTLAVSIKMVLAGRWRCSTSIFALLFAGHLQGILLSIAFPHVGHFKGIRVCPSSSEDSYDSVHDVLESHLLKL